MVHFLVGRFVPFVVYINSIFIPFVCRNIPNSTYQTVTKRVNGFTLIELVVTMAVAAILVAVAVPNMRTFIQNGRLNTQTNDLIGDLNLARSEAIKRRAFVGVCKSTNGTTCAGGGDWRDGRVVFVGTGPNGTFLPGIPGNTILRFREPLASALDSLNTTPAVNQIIFSANGASNDVGAGFFFVFCDGRGPSNRKQINLNTMGQAAVSAPALGPC